jgi:hypothetical protein
MAVQRGSGRRLGVRFGEPSSLALRVVQGAPRRIRHARHLLGVTGWPHYRSRALGAQPRLNSERSTSIEIGASFPRCTIRWQFAHRIATSVLGFVITALSPSEASGLR